MITSLNEIFQAILISSLFVIVFSPLMIVFSKKIGLVDQPGSALHKKHAITTPITGGLLLAASLTLTILVVPTDYSLTINGILFGTLIMIVVGLIDDFIDLSPVFKLLGQIISATVIISFGVQVRITQVVVLDLAITYLRYFERIELRR
jgi:UDP-GlcNAc:undecaprenyl-phosphate GlcNAc-1-phosphate transferase